MTRKKPYKHCPAHIRKIRARKNQFIPIINAMITAFDNEDYEQAYRLAKEAQESIGCFWATFNTFRGLQENGVEEVWAM